ncbi:MCE family protein [Streptomyces sp. NPDC051940]|uniref:MCE family protein n=1 Tax=Streptomyces sp. NPDC051940 TaxID=3155675 RepID=UPI00341B41FD
MSRPRLLKPIRERNPVGVALVGLVVLALAGLLAYRADALPLIGRGGTTYTADFKESAGLTDGDEVRIAGVKVGEVTGVGLDGAKVKVTFTVRDAWVGNGSRAGIAIKTLLGDKYLAVEPLGDAPQDPGSRIPVSRTTSPYDVTDAFQDLSSTFGEIDSAKLGESFEVIAATFENTPPNVKRAAEGLSALSRTVSSRDSELSRLLGGSDRISKTLADQSARFETLLTDGNLLLGEIRQRRTAIHSLLIGAQDLGRELSGLVDDNNEQIGPTLDALDRVTEVLQRNEKNLEKAIAVAGPYYRLVGNALGNGRWFDSYLCGLVPKNYLPPGTPPANDCMPPKTKSNAGGR